VGQVLDLGQPLLKPNRNKKPTKKEGVRGRIPFSGKTRDPDGVNPIQVELKLPLTRNSRREGQ